MGELDQRLLAVRRSGARFEQRQAGGFEPARGLGDQSLSEMDPRLVGGERQGALDRGLRCLHVAQLGANARKAEMGRDMLLVALEDGGKAVACGQKVGLPVSQVCGGKPWLDRMRLPLAERAV